MDKLCQVAAMYIASLRAMLLIHQQNHWVSKGESFYGDHLLFQRLYESAGESADLAAEKFVGLLGVEVLDYDTQTQFLNKVLDRYAHLEGSPAELSMAIEKEFLKLSQGVYDAFEEADTLSLGLDDCIMSIASKREVSIYLLQQRTDSSQND